MNKLLKTIVLAATIITTVSVGGIIAKADTLTNYGYAYDQKFEGKLIKINNYEAYANTKWDYKGKVYTWCGASNSNWIKIDQTESYGYNGASETRDIDIRNFYLLQSRHSPRTDGNIYKPIGRDVYNDMYK